MPCSACSALDFNLRIPKRANRLFAVLHQNEDSFHRALILGCSFCHLISSQLSSTSRGNDDCKELGAFMVLNCYKTEQTRPSSHASFPLNINVTSRLGTAVLDVIDPIPVDYYFIYANTSLFPSQSQGQSVEHNTKRSVKRQKLNPSPSSTEIQAPVDTSTGSSTNLRLARFWLHQCVHSHPSCSVNHGSQAAPFVPTRLINLASPDKPFLEETGGQSKRPFVALSYTWGEGKRKRVQTERDTFERYKTCLPMKELPKTFAHAIRVTRSLGYKYLWTDAFCIIQGKGGDQEQEIPKMGDIYRYAEFTIYARIADNPDAGFFVDRDPRRCRPCKIPISITADGQSRKTELTLATACNGPDHLEPRGWILQERVLSSRLLIFGKQMEWICSTCEAQETRPVLRPRKAHAKGSRTWGVEKLRSSIYGTSPTISEPRNPQDFTSQFDLWYGILEEYGKTKLSYESDILNAVAGIADLFAKQHGATFERGLWREDLQFGLAWYVVLNEPRPVSVTIKQPSWSWASVGKVRIKFRSWTSTKGPLEGVGCKILSIDNGHGSSPEEKECTIITLQAPVLKAKLCYNARFSSARQKKSPGGPGTEFDGIDTREHPRYPALLLRNDTIQPVGEAALDREFHLMQPPADASGKTTPGSIVDVECILLHAQRAFFDKRGTVLIVRMDEKIKVYRRVGLGFVVGKYMSWLGISNLHPGGDPKVIATKEMRIM